MPLRKHSLAHSPKELIYLYINTDSYKYLERKRETWAKIVISDQTVSVTINLFDYYQFDCCNRVPCLNIFSL